MLLHVHCIKTDQFNMIEIAKEIVGDNQVRLRKFIYSKVSFPFFYLTFSFFHLSTYLYIIFIVLAFFFVKDLRLYFSPFLLPPTKKASYAPDCRLLLKKFLIENFICCAVKMYSENIGQYMN